MEVEFETEWKKGIKLEAKDHPLTMILKIILEIILKYIFKNQCYSNIYILYVGSLIIEVERVKTGELPLLPTWGKTLKERE